MPIAFGWLTKRGDAVDHALAGAGPLDGRDPPRHGPRPARDRAGRTALVEAADRLPAFHRPALIVWATEDRVMPPEHGRRLAALLPDARLVELDDTTP